MGERRSLTTWTKETSRLELPFRVPETQGSGSGGAWASVSSSSLSSSSLSSSTSLSSKTTVLQPTTTQPQSDSSSPIASHSRSSPVHTESSQVILGQTVQSYKESPTHPPTRSSQPSRNSAASPHTYFLSRLVSFRLSKTRLPFSHRALSHPMEG